MWSIQSSTICFECRIRACRAQGTEHVSETDLFHVNTSSSRYLENSVNADKTGANGQTEVYLLGNHLHHSTFIASMKREVVRIPSSELQIQSTARTRRFKSEEQVDVRVRASAQKNFEEVRGKRSGVRRSVGFVGFHMRPAPRGGQRDRTTCGIHDFLICRAN